MAEIHNLSVEASQAGMRLDAYIAQQIDGISRSYGVKLIEGGCVTCQGLALNKKYTVKTADEIDVEIPEAVETDILPEKIPLDIVYEDDELLIINKAQGMVVHPGAGNYTGTLVNALLHYCRGNLSGIGGVLRPGIVHRIDKDTTGSIIACKNDMSHKEIAAQLKEHSIVRKYRAICAGVIKEDSGTVNAPIGRDEKDRKKMSVNPKNGKEAITHYHVLERFKDYTYIECVLETGRTHQIRVHMASIGHPLLGDEVYSSRKWPYKLVGQTLHAYILGFKHPRNSQYIETVAPLPEYFVLLLDKLRKM